MKPLRYDGRANLPTGTGIGRPKGLQDKICRDLKQGLLQGATLHGYDGQGQDGLIGYCHHIAARHPKIFCHLLEKLLPYCANATLDGTVPSRGIVAVVVNPVSRAASVLARMAS